MELLPEMQMTGRFPDLLMMEDRLDSQPEDLLDSQALVPLGWPESFRLEQLLLVPA
jgi:hypothetical protein